jgi:hypothetical protein
LNLEAVRDQIAYAYLRYHDEFEDPILVLLNFSEQPTELKFSLPAEFASLVNVGKLDDLLTGEQVPLGTGEVRTVSVPGYGVRLLSIKGIPS